jgi:hypothetical protein
MTDDTGTYDMEVLTQIPFELDAAAILKTVHIEPDSSDGRTVGHLIDLARRMARPKALYKEAFINAKEPDTVTIEGTTFTSRILRANLEPVQRVFAFVATCGHELDAAELPPGDFLVEFWWDTIKAALLGCAIRHLNEHLKRRYAMDRTASMSPGSGDAAVWPIEQQRELFTLLGDVKGRIGVELTESFLMKPNKTVSGICFATKVDFRTCQVCHRQDCPSRSAPFNPDLWELHQHR